MNSQGQPRPSLDVRPCSVCDEPVPVDRVRLLAHRDDLRFVQVDCPACGSTTLGFLADRPDPADGPAAAPAVTADDVLEMHRFLATFEGDLRDLVRRGAEGLP